MKREVYMTAAIERYKRKVKRKLRCGSIAKLKLMVRFEAMLKVYLDDFGWPACWPTEAELISAFGPPEKMAQVLMADISRKEIIRYHIFSWFIRIVVLLLLVSFILLSIYICQ